MTIRTLIVFLLFSLLTTARASVGRNFFSRGSSFSVEDASASSILTSSDKTFTFGFYSVSPSSNAYYLSIWFTKSTEKTVVWTANRDKPVNGRGSAISLRKDGAFVLTDIDGSTVWQTNTTSTYADRAELLSSGNLVLKGGNGSVLWQSFDFPTDTLLPAQKFTKSNRLVSSVGPNRFDSGYFSFYFDSDNVLRMIYNGPEISSIYWPNVDLTVFQNGRTSYNSSRLAVLDDMGVFTSTDQLYFSASDVGSHVKRRLTMDHDGNLRLYSLNESSGLWVKTWQAIKQLCTVHGLCGKNGVCVYTPEPRCSCPPYYEPSDPRDWRKGCKPKFVRSCNDSKFIEMPHSDFYGFDLMYAASVPLEKCKKMCRDDCRCLGFGYKSFSNECYGKSILFNGIRINGQPSSMYLRVPKGEATSEPTDLTLFELACGGDQKDKTLVLPTTYEMKNKKFKWVYLYSFASAIGAIEVIISVTAWWFLYRKNGISASMEDGYRVVSSQFRSFSYSELKRATRKFKEILGRGGFGTVYKGVSEDERIVAVKKLGDVVQGEDEFWAEVSTIGRINHMNLTRMWGFCSEGRHRLLVYEYIENGSLDKHLFSDTTLLGWKERFKIAAGTAKGLAYLHHECLEWVIHCDVKPENILIDIDFEPKISDFGLARLSQRSGHESSELTKIRGTKGYMAPEWAMNLPITAKVDVFSFGVVILELVKGIRLSNRVVDDQHASEGISELVMFVSLAKEKIDQNGEDNSWVSDMVDPRIRGDISKNQAAVMIKIGLSCVEENRNKRPTMETVAQVLAECEDDDTGIR